MKEITYKYDEDTGIVEFYINNECFTDWATEGDEASFELALEEFNKIYRNAYESGLKGEKVIFLAI